MLFIPLPQCPAVLGNSFAFYITCTCGGGRVESTDRLMHYPFVFSWDLLTKRLKVIPKIINKNKPRTKQSKLYLSFICVCVRGEDE